MLRNQFAVVSVAALSATFAHAEMIGVNVLLNRPADETVLAELNAHGQVLDVIPEINAVTLRAQETELPAIQTLSCVTAANTDARCELASIEPLPVADLFTGSTMWNLDAINVTDYAGGRCVAYDGEGVYVAIIDTGLPHNWRAYFPEQRIATQFARAFTGGGGQAHTISDQPQKWEHDTDGHGTTLASVILGFAYSGSDQDLPVYFNGVAPRATVIPVRCGFESAGFNSAHWHFESVAAHAFVYVANLKVSGALGDAPLVINFSSGDPSRRPTPLLRAAIDYAISNGAVVVSVAGNEAGAGMRYPGAYPEVISVAAAGWIGQVPADDPTSVEWIVRDVPEGGASQYFIAPFSSRQLAGQELDIAAPGVPIPCALTVNGTADYTFQFGTSQAAPHVAGVAALMLQKNPGLSQAQVETILKSTAMPLPPGCRDIRWFGAGSGNFPTWDDHDNVFYFNTTFCWEADATGAGLVQADAALAVTPLP